MKTKKDFEFTAALINAANNGTPAPVLATLAAAQFAKDNPRFDADRFKRACGLTWSQIEGKGSFSAIEPVMQESI